MASVTVYVWDVTHEGSDSAYVEAVVRDDPSVNATASKRLDPDPDVRPLLVEAWNRAHPDDRRDLSGFNFTKPSARWRNPNDPT